MLLLICGLLGVGLGLWLCLKDGIDHPIELLFSLFIGVMGLGIGVVLSLVCTTGVTYQDSYVFSNDIISLKGNSEVSSSFFLGTGSINEHQYYVYYLDLGSSRYKLDKVKTSRTIIVQDNNLKDKGELRVFEGIAVGNVWSKLAGPFKNECSKQSYELVVPEGTIIKEFKL